MSQYLHLDDTTPNSKYAVSIYAHRLIAFFPKDGFAAFEGYCHLQKDELPYTINAYTKYAPNTPVGIFKLCITEVIRKIVQAPSWEKKEECTCQATDFCECSIRFFPSNIVIIKFTTEDEKDVDWDKKIDPNFSLERYMSLVDEPDYGTPYKLANQDFYDEYHKFIRNG
jgi:hypothetical protein